MTAIPGVRGRSLSGEKQGHGDKFFFFVISFSFFFYIDHMNATGLRTSFAWLTIHAQDLYSAEQLALANFTALGGWEGGSLSRLEPACDTMEAVWDL